MLFGSKSTSTLVAADDRSVELGRSREIVVRVKTRGVALTCLVKGAASQFEISNSTCSAALTPGGTCTITVRFAPTLSTPPDKAAQLTVTATPGGSTSADLQGAALP